MCIFRYIYLVFCKFQASYPVHWEYINIFVDMLISLFVAYLIAVLLLISGLFQPFPPSFFFSLPAFWPPACPGSSFPYDKMQKTVLSILYVLYDNLNCKQLEIAHTTRHHTVSYSAQQRFSITSEHEAQSNTRHKKSKRQINSILMLDALMHISYYDRL